MAVGLLLKSVFFELLLQFIHVQVDLVLAKWWILVFWSGVMLTSGKFFASLTYKRIFTCVPFSQIVTGAGTFEIHLVSIQNIRGEKYDGSCCDGSRTIYRGQHQCLDECDTFFRVCLKQYSQSVSPTGACTFGEHTTAVLGGSSITFTNTTSPSGFRNPISLRFEFSWLVSHCKSCAMLS